MPHRSRLILLVTLGAIAISATFSVSPSRASDLPRAKPESVGMSTDRLRRITEFFQAAVDREEIAGAQTLVARRGKVVHFESVGLADIERKQAIDETTIFGIASMTKPITSVALLTLYEKGRFRLTDPVSMHIPELSGLRVYAGTDDEGELVLEDQNREMTVQDLMRHTAGLTYGAGATFGEDVTPIDMLYDEAKLFDARSTLRGMIGKLAQIPLLYQPGTRWHYSIAVDVQGYLVERLSGLPFDEFLRKGIFQPLGMDDTAFYVPEEKVSRLAKTYTHHEGNLIEDPDRRHLEKPIFMSGGGGLVSTTADYWRFAQMLENGGELEGVRILGQKTVEYMASDHSAGIDERDSWMVSGLGFGLGVGVVTDPAAAGMITSQGEYYWEGAACTSFLIDPKEELVAIMMIQYRPYNWLFAQDFRTLVYPTLVN